jgi:DNA-binding HxlR family transcriptional regulator
MKRKCLEHSECAVARALDVIGDWWSLLILREAFRGARRFGEFQKGLEIAKNILSARLRKLVADGVLTTLPAADGSAFHEYALTEKGRGLFIVIVALRQWGASALYEPGEPLYSVVDRRTGKPIRPLELRSQDGRALAPEDIEIVCEPTNCQSEPPSKSKKLPPKRPRKSKPLPSGKS